MSTSKEILDKHAKLRDAIKKGDQETAKQLILNNAVVNLGSKSSSNTLLHWAITNFQDTEIVEILLDKKANVRGKNYFRQTPLALAVHFNKADVVKLLLNKGAHVGDDMKSLIYTATSYGNEDLVQLLVEYGVKSGPTVNLKNSLGLAVEKGHPKIVEAIIPYCKFQKLSDKQIPKDAVLKDGQEFKDCIDLLLQNGFIISPGSKKDGNFIYSAVEKGFTSIVRELLNQGIDVNMVGKRTGLQLLHAACLNKHLAIAEMLIEHKADVNAVIAEKKMSRNKTFQVNLIGKTPLYVAVMNCDIELTKLLVKHGAKINEDPNFFSLMSMAIAKESKDIIEILVEHGANVNASNAYGKTLLHCCGMFNFKRQSGKKDEISEFLIKKGANVNATTQVGTPPLFTAIQNGYVKIAKTLLENNADFRHVDIYGNTSLHVAAGEFIRPEFLEMLLKHDLDVNVANEHGMTPLHIACKRQLLVELNSIKNLLQHGANINCIDENQQTPLHLACYEYNPQIVQVLLEHNAQVNMVDKNGKTPLHLATERKCTDVMENLLKHKADPNLKDKDGKTPLHIAVTERVDGNNLDMIEVLLKHNADVNAADSKGWTPLFYACKIDKMFIIQELLDNNADVNYVDAQGTTPLCVAAQNTWMESDSIRLLIEYNANAYFINGEGKTLLHIVAEQNHLDVVDMLISMNININYTDKNGRTALHLAAEKGHKQMVLSLLKHGADVNVLDKNNNTALQSALENVARVRKEFSDFQDNLANLFGGRLMPEDLDDEKSNSYRTEINTYHQIMKILIKHIIKLQCADLPVNTENFKLVCKNVFPTGEFDDESINTYGFESSCDSEIKQLKAENIGKNCITFYDLLAKSVHNIARFAKNESISKTLEMNSYSKKFPLYIDMIRNRYAEGVARSKLLGVARKYSLPNIFPGLPLNCVDEIFSYLSNKEIRKFINIVKPQKKCEK